MSLALYFLVATTSTRCLASVSTADSADAVVPAQTAVGFAAARPPFSGRDSRNGLHGDDGRFVEQHAARPLASISVCVERAVDDLTGSVCARDRFVARRHEGARNAERFRVRRAFGRVGAIPL